jgi:hypothetical protein
MTSIAIAKRSDASLTDQQRQLLRGVLFEMFGGCTEDDDRMWKRAWGELINAGSGEVFTWTLEIEQDGHFHRRHMKLEQEVFNGQEQYYSFEQFRNWLKTGAGFVEWHIVRGQMVPVPKSKSYAKCKKFEMEKFHTDAIAFLRTPRAQSELWPHLSPSMAQESIETLLSSFERQE